MMELPNNPTRRPIKSRESAWAPRVVAFLAQKGVKPNWVSLMSVAFAAMAGLCLILSGEASRWLRILLFLMAALLIQLRLLCNLFDGMLAVEHGLGSKFGEIYNDLPDRPADLFILVSAGYAMPHSLYSVTMAWMVGALALMSAYVRVLGRSIGTASYFSGPMAKQHRMAVMTGACILAAFAELFRRNWNVFIWALWIILAGLIVTLIRRVYLIVFELKKS